MEITEPFVDAFHLDVKHRLDLVPFRRLLCQLMIAVGCQHTLEALAVLRHAIAERKVDESDEEIDLDAEAHPLGIDDDGLGGAQQVEESDDDHEDVSLKNAMNVLTSAGMEIRSACGNTIRIVDGQ